MTRDDILIGWGMLIGFVGGCIAMLGFVIWH
jgi:hypothetical protein